MSEVRKYVLSEEELLEVYNTMLETNKKSIQVRYIEMYAIPSSDLVFNSETGKWDPISGSKTRKLLELYSTLSDSEFIVMQKNKTDSYDINGVKTALNWIILMMR